MKMDDNIAEERS
jgi:hypothetical protein